MKETRPASESAIITEPARPSTTLSTAALRIAGWLLAIIALAAVCRMAQPAWDQVMAAGIRPHAGWLLASMAMLGVAYALAVDRWCRWLKGFGATVPYGVAFVWSFRTILAKYLPGGGWHFAARAGLAARANISPAAAAIAMVIDDCVMIAVGALLGVVVLAAAGARQTSLGEALGIFTVGVGSMLALPAALRRVVAWTRPAEPSPPIGTRLVARMASLCLGGWVVHSLAFVMLAQALSAVPLSAMQVATLWGSLPLAWAMGAVVVLAPAGLGVREAGLTALLSIAFPAEWAAILAIASRLWSLTVEGTLFACVWALPGAGSAVDADAGV